MLLFRIITGGAMTGLGYITFRAVAGNDLGLTLALAPLSLLVAIAIYVSADGGP